MERWEEIICESTCHEWVAVKMLDKFAQHLKKYPGFDIERAARYFAMHDEKTQKRMCYEDAASINKGAKIVAESSSNLAYKEYQKLEKQNTTYYHDYDDGSRRF